MKITSSDLVDKCLSGPKSYSNGDLMTFTLNFSESNKIGSGGYGVVYKGQFPNGDLVAVKVLEENDVVEETFMAEVNTMVQACHRNLVKLYGYCCERDMKALVYEYMENGSLDRILYENHHSNINWDKLYGIAIETARGLNYLHDGLDKQIIHYDIKAANVLLDKNYSAKITDFGLAKLMNRNVSRVDLTRIRGTAGYNAPETWMPGSQVSCKCDVYSFGMMLFEILGKRRNGVEENWFPRHVWKQFENGKLEQLIRDCGITEKDKEKAKILCEVALCCAHHRPEQRPSMMEVVLMLKENLPVGKPSYPFLPGQFYDSSIIPSVEVIPPVHSAVSPTRNGRDHKGIKLPTTTVVGTAALGYSKMVLQWVVNEEIVTIGIHGMGGVGKTTILKNIYNKLLADRNCFDKIIWVTVSKDANDSKLQHDIAESIDLKLSKGDDMLKNSRLLLQALEKMKRFVLVLDDMWQAISLVEIGIPQPTREDGCKLLLTTRSLDVCKRMGCHEDHIITVKPLPEDEAWELFMNKVDVVLTPEVRAIAELVAKECSGLPLAIITVGGAMRGQRDIVQWRVALNDLQDFSNRITDIEDTVFKHLKFSYDRLANEKLKNCFLYCALYPEDYKIPTIELVDFWIMDGLVKERNRHNELLQGQFILTKLKDHCLLENGYSDDDERVKMHDLIRDMALRITDNTFMVQDGVKCLPNEIEWGEVLERASFMDNLVEQVSISPRCPKLSTLFFSGSYYLMNIGNDFFVNMQCLRVLDLRNSGIISLPDSISDLVNLRALRLSWCQILMRVPSLAKLVRLRTLELDHTSIEELPEGIEMLVNLRCLNLNSIMLRKGIPMGLISKFSELQNLDLGGIHADKVYVSGSGTSFAKELLSLKELENLYISFHCFSDYARYGGSAKFNHRLKHFVLKIGESRSLRHLFGNVMSFTIDSSEIGRITQNAVPILENTEFLEISGFKDLTSFCNRGRLIQLREFCIDECKEIDCIWSFLEGDEVESSSTGTTTASSALQCLERIYISGCPKLYTIFKGIRNIGVLSCLKKLEIWFCDGLKNVFSSSRLLQHLQNLEEIEIQFCEDELEELIGEEEEEENRRNAETPITIPRLKRLTFGNLPILKSIWRGVMICNSLESVYVHNCSELERLPQFTGKEQSILPPASLIEIIGSREWWDSLEWDPAYPKYNLQPFFKEKPDYVSGDTEDGIVAASSQSDGEESSQSDLHVTHKRRRLYYQSESDGLESSQSDINVNHKRRKLYYQSGLNVYNGIIHYNAEEVQSIEDEAANGSFSLISVLCKWILCSCFSAPSI
ncbi:hypothetical protein AQUCO_10100011v1 [Aquilegia coerulea]|uniref:non-specific serine/threonine protein kinase n=1 Tax=Aquilegia coerulea TaxID=218851 RepID=A0A2G5C440_AQUCA|nr:hypothetical protein AQUCO_10100011v1 [Aquilegia coerulea]